MTSRERERERERKFGSDNKREGGRELGYSIRIER
jgi:hypothetical protein